MYLLHFLDDCCLFFFNAPATTEIYTLSLHDALPIYRTSEQQVNSTIRVATKRLDDMVDMVGELVIAQ